MRVSNQKMTKTRQTSNKGVGILILSSIFLFLVVVLSFSKDRSEKNNSSQISLDSFHFDHSAFEEAILDAHVAYIEDLETGQSVYQKNATNIQPLASLTKIMTTYAALSVMPHDYPITIKAPDLAFEGDHGLVLGEVWELDKLIVFMLVTSSNDAAQAIAREGERFTGGISFPQYMTGLAEELGFETLSFSNPTGLDLDSSETVPGAVGSAEDISKLFNLAYQTYPEVFDQTKKSLVSISSNTMMHNIENTNTFLDSLPGVVGSKTGYTKTAGGNLSIIVDIDERPHVVTVLESTREGRFYDVGKIIGLVQEEVYDN